MILLSLVLQACKKDLPEACDQGAVLSDGTCAPAGCAMPDGGNVPVSGGGSALASALETATSGDVLAVEPGTYDGEVRVPSGVQVRGWCTEHVVVQAGYVTPNLEIDAATEVVIAGLTVRGGVPAVYVSGGAGEVVVLEGLVVSEGGTYGLRIAGDADVTVDGVEVDGTLEGAEGRGGRGLSAQGGAVVSVRASTFTNNVEAGIVADNATLDLQDVTVIDTRSTSEGRLGRGIQAQNGSSLTVGGASVVERSGDAGVCVLDSDARVTKLAVRETSEVGGIGGDGIAVFLGAGTGSRTVTIEDVVVEANDRAAIIIDGASAKLVGTISTRENAWSLVSQSGAVVQNPEAVQTGSGEPQLFDPIEVLGIDDEPMQ